MANDSEWSEMTAEKNMAEWQMANSRIPNLNAENRECSFNGQIFSLFQVFVLFRALVIHAMNEQDNNEKQ